MTKTTTANKITARCKNCKGPAKRFGKTTVCASLRCK